MTNRLSAIAERLGDAMPLALRWALAGEPRPLAIGAREDLAARLVASGMPPHEAGGLAWAALRDCTVQSRYQYALALDGSERYSLDGEVVGRVDAPDRMAAAALYLAQGLSRMTRQAGGTGRAALVAGRAAPVAGAGGAAGGTGRARPAPLPLPGRRNDVKTRF